MVTSSNRKDSVYSFIIYNFSGAHALIKVALHIMILGKDLETQLKTKKLVP